MTGSMIIPNSLGLTTLLLLTFDKAFATPPENSHESSIADARACLKREKASLSGRVGNVKFLETWLSVAVLPPVVPPTPAPVIIPPVVPPASTITPPSKTSVRLLNEPWEEDNYLKNKGEKINASA